MATVMVKLLAGGKFVPSRMTEYCPEQQISLFSSFLFFVVLKDAL